MSAFTMSAFSRSTAVLSLLAPLSLSLSATAADVPAAAGIEVAVAPVTVLSEVKVTAEKDGSSTAPSVADARAQIEKTPGGVDLVGAEEFENRYAVSFKDTLRDVPGVFAQARFGEEVRLSIRGSGLGRSAHLRGVYLLEDGLPVSRADGFGDFQEIDPLTTRYLEVYKGANALRYGSSTLGGAINVVTPTGRTAGQTWLLRLDGGSNDTYREHLAYAKDYGDVDVYAAFTNSQSDGYRDQQRSDNQRFSGNIGYRITPAAETRFYLNFNEIDQELPGALSLNDALNNPRSVAATSNSFNTKRDPTTLRLANKTSVKFGGGQLDVGVYYWDRRLFHPVTGVVVDQRGDFYGSFAQWNGEGHLFGLANEVTLGSNAALQHNNARVFANSGGQRGAISGDATEEAGTYDLYGENRLWVREDLSLIIGAQGLVTTRDYTDRRNAAESADRTYKAFNPKLGLLWAVDDHTQVFGNVSTSYEAPDYGALNQTTAIIAGGAALGTGGFVPLDAQRALAVEIGTRGEWQRLAWNLTYYHANVDKELLLRANTPTTAVQFNADETVHQGVEAGLAIRLLSDGLTAGDKLTFHQTYTWNEFSFDHDATYGNARLAGVPEHYYQAQLRYDHPLGFFVEPGVEAANHNYVDYANTQTAPGYAIWNLSTGVTLPHGLSLFFDARNLFNRGYVGSVSTTTNFQTTSNKNLFLPGEGRLFFGGLRWAFG